MFTFMAAFALALGIGANTAIFSVVDGVVLEGLPYRDSDRIVMLWEDSTPRGGTNRVPVSPGNFMDWREANPSFTELAALFNTSLRVTSVDEPLVPLTHMVTANYFDLLGVEPALGRTLGSLLYGVSVTDTATFTAAALSMLAVASIASVVPAWRASRIDPIVALRQE